MSAILKKPDDLVLTGTPEIDWAARAEQIANAIAADAARHDHDETFVSGSYQKLKAAGFFKALVPVELGGLGASQAEICRAIRRIGASCGSTALAFSMHSHLVAVAAWRWRHQNAPTDGLLKRVAAEDLILVSSGGSDWLKSAGIVATGRPFLMRYDSPWTPGFLRRNEVAMEIRR